MKKDLAYVCNYFKALIIPHTPDGFKVSKPFRHELTDDELRKGIAAFREFLYDLFDLLATKKDEIDIETGSKYAPKGMSGFFDYWGSFPSIFDLTIILLTIGTHGGLETEPEMKLTVRGEDLITPVCPITEKYQSVTRMSGERKLEMFRLLSDLGLHFNGADFSEEVDFSKAEIFSITSKKNDFWAVGLKLISEATANHKNYYKMENLFTTVFLRCYFYPLANAVPKDLKLSILEYANGQKTDIKKWIIHVDRFLRNNGCKMIHNYNGSNFTYIKRKTSVTDGYVCGIIMGITGCFIAPGINHLSKSNNILNMLPDDMVDMIISGMERGQFNSELCYRSSGNMGFARFSLMYNGEEFEGCRHTGRCQFSGDKCRFIGFNFDLADPVVRELMMKWIEMELAV